MRRPTLSIALYLGAATASAQPAPPRTPLTWQRPAREDGVILLAPERRNVPPSERAITRVATIRTTTVGPMRWGLGAFAGMVVTGIGLAVTMQLTRPPPPGRASLPSRVPSAAHPGVEVRRLTLCLDWNLRASIDLGIAQLRARLPPDASGAPHAVASALRDLLARAHTAMRAAAFHTCALDPQQAQQTVSQVNMAMRARGLPSSLAALRRSAPSSTEERLTAITVLVATRCPLPPLPSRVEKSTALAVLDSMVPPKPDQLVALEVIWAPDAQSEALTRAEFAALFPELVRFVAEG